MYIICVSVPFKLGLENSRAAGLVVQWTRHTRDQRDVSSQQETGTQIPASFCPALFFWNLFLPGLWIVSHLHSSRRPAFASGPLLVSGSHFNLTFGLFEKVGRFRHKSQSCKKKRSILTSPPFQGPEVSVWAPLALSSRKGLSLKASIKERFRTHLLCCH